MYKNISFKGCTLDSACRMFCCGLLSVEDYIELLEVAICND